VRLAPFTLLVLAAPAAAQHVGIGFQGAFGDYREVAADLHYRGVGGGGTAFFTLGKLSGDVGVVWLDFDPAAGSAAVEKFQARQFDARVRWYLVSGVSAEVGVTSRAVDPDFAAQAMAALRLGLRAVYALGPEASLSFRGNYLGAARFSGGGSAPFGVELALGLSAGTRNGRVRLIADYEFQRVDRKTNPGGAGEVKVPIEQSVARVGVAVGY